jgi:hypothetical protein
MSAPCRQPVHLAVRGLRRACLAIIALLVVFAVTVWSSLGGPSGSASAQNSPAPLRLVDQFVGDIRAVAARGANAWVGRGPRLVSFDVADAAHLRPIGQTAILDGVVQDVALQGDVAWLAAGSGGLYAVDVSDLDAPRVVGQRRLTGAGGTHVNQVEVFGDPAIVYQRQALFQEEHDAWIVPTGDPTGLAGQAVGHLSVQSPINGVAVHGQTLYVAAGDTLNGAPAFIAVYDITDPLAPRQVRWLDQTADPVGMAVSGNRLIVVFYNYETGNHITVYDIGRAGVLTEVANTPIAEDYPGEMVLDGDRLYLFADYEIRRYVLQTNGVVTALGTPLADDRLINAWAANMAVDSGRLFVATSQQSGLLVIDTTRRDALRVVGDYPVPDMVSQVGATESQVLLSSIVDHRIWSTDRARRDPLAEPFPLPEISSDGFDTEPARELLYITSTSEEITGTSGVWVYDAHDPQNPRVLGNLPTDDSYDGITVLDGLALVERMVFEFDYGYNVLDLFDVSDPAQIRRLAVPEIQVNSIRGVPIARDHVYVPSRDTLQVLDVRDHDQVQVTTSVTLTGAPDVVAARGTCLYLANGAGIGIATIDDPGRPVGVQTGVDFETDAGDVTDMGFLDDRLIVLQEDALSVFDLTDPLRPALIAQSPTLWLGYDMTLLGGRIYIADTVAGVTVWEVPTDLPRVTVTPLPRTTLTPDLFTPTPTPGMKAFLPVTFLWHE